MYTKVYKVGKLSMRSYLKIIFRNDAPIVYSNKLPSAFTKHHLLHMYDNLSLQYEFLYCMYVCV